MQVSQTFANQARVKETTKFNPRNGSAVICRLVTVSQVLGSERSFRRFILATDHLAARTVNGWHWLLKSTLEREVRIDGYSSVGHTGHTSREQDSSLN